LPTADDGKGKKRGGSCRDDAACGLWGGKEGKKGTKGGKRFIMTLILIVWPEELKGREEKEKKKG